LKESLAATVSCLPKTTTPTRREEPYLVVPLRGSANSMELDPLETFGQVYAVAVFRLIALKELPADQSAVGPDGVYYHYSQETT
jgi:hypothetical protein